jgi:hypothetical protein
MTMKGNMPQVYVLHLNENGTPSVYSVSLIQLKKNLTVNNPLDIAHVFNKDGFALFTADEAKNPNSEVYRALEGFRGHFHDRTWKHIMGQDDPLPQPTERRAQKNATVSSPKPSLT